MGVFPAMYVCAPRVCLVLMRPDEGIEFLGTVLADDYELPWVLRIKPRSSRRAPSVLSYLSRPNVLVISKKSYNKPKNS